MRTTWDRMVTYALAELRLAIGDLSLKAEHQDSGLDSIAVAAPLFEHMQRVKANARGGLAKPHCKAQGEKEQYSLVSMCGAR